MRHHKSVPFTFTVIGNYLSPSVVVTKDGKQIETLKLSGPSRGIVIGDLIKLLGNSKATKLVAFGQTVENETWR
jgi:hypothetical protein